MSYLYFLFLRVVSYLEGEDQIIGFAVFLALMVLSLNYLMPKKLDKKTATVFVNACIIGIIVVVHTAIISLEIELRDVTVVALYLIWFIYFTLKFRTKTINQALLFLLISFSIYNITNYVLFELYFYDTKWGYNQTLSYFNIVDYYAVYPLSSGRNVNSSQIGLMSILATYFFKVERRFPKKWIFLAISLAHIYFLVLADTRIAIGLTLLLTLSLFVNMKKMVDLIKTYWKLLIVAIFSFITVFYTTPLFDFLKREGELNPDNLNRIEIWTAAIRVIFDDIKFLFGHGINGFGKNFPPEWINFFLEQQLQTTHNALFQYMVDFGIIGVIAYLVLFVKLLDSSLRFKERIIFVLLIATFFYGITESIPTFYSFEPTILFLSLVAILFIKNEGKSH
jgi:hypothetical protein